MIAVEEALSIVLKNRFALTETEILPLEQCLNRNLAKAVQAPIDLPRHRLSSMDGFALCIHNSNRFILKGEVKAGDAQNPDLQPGECVRIFTGAVVPDKADTVVMQEKTQRKENIIIIEPPLHQNQNIRQVGSQVKKGDFPLEKGQVLQASGLAFLRSLGFEKVEVIRNPKVTLILTGNELTNPGKPLTRGKIYESNSLLLQIALEQQGIQPQLITHVEDSIEATSNTLKNALNNSDVVLVSGGISVGDYDFVKVALEQLAVETLFYKVRQRPGKPLYFGKKENSFVFALPGNPASTLSCFYIYVVPLLIGLKGGLSEGLMRINLPLAHDFKS